ncbi:MAG: hypothetical protein IK093_10015 [Ruminiclostridium sp.]|nr:hypothetical protein [Ruminiclostridium sp.]
MAFMLYSIDDAVDCKYIVIKSMREQAKMGTLIHIMDAHESSDGITVKYRVTKTQQDFTIKFDTIKQFCNWCMPSTFLAKYYDKLSTRDIIRYIKIEKRGFWSFYFPIILFVLVAVWLVALLVLKDMTGVLLGIIIGSVLSVIAVVGVFLISHFSKSHMIESLYRKVS